MPTKRRNKTNPGKRKKTTPSSPDSDSKLLTNLPRKVLLKRFSTPSDWQSAGIQRITLTRKRPYRQRGGARRPPVSSGLFQSLPVELFQMILYELDCQSLAQLAATNSALETFINGQDFYRLVVENCLNVISSAAQIYAPKALTAKQFYDAFKDPHCTGCGNLGPFIFLPSFSRCCRPCIGRKSHLSVMTVQDAYPLFKISRTDVLSSGLCYLHCQKHTNSSQRHHQREPKDCDLAITASDAFYLASQRHSLEQCQSMLAKAARCCKFLPNSCGVNCVHVLPFAFIDSDAKTVEFGRHCEACKSDYIRSLLFDDESESESGSEIEFGSELGTWAVSKRPQHRLSRAKSAQVVHTSRTLLAHLRSGECRWAARDWRADQEESEKLNPRSINTRMYQLGL